MAQRQLAALMITGPVGAALLAVAAPAASQPASPRAPLPGPVVDAAGRVYGDAVPVQQTAADQARAEWLGECRRRQSADRVNSRRRNKAASDQPPRRDFCETYLDDYTASVRQFASQQAYPANGARITYQPMMVMVPVMQQPVATPQASRSQTETVEIEEWVTVSTPRARTSPVRRSKPVKRAPKR